MLRQLSVEIGLRVFKRVVSAGGTYSVTVAGAGVSAVVAFVLALFVSTGGGWVCLTSVRSPGAASSRGLMTRKKRATTAPDARPQVTQGSRELRATSISSSAGLAVLEDSLVPGAA
jgi:hypothetical protein